MWRCSAANVVLVHSQAICKGNIIISSQCSESAFDILAFFFFSVCDVDIAPVMACNPIYYCFMKSVSQCINTQRLQLILMCLLCNMTTRRNHSANAFYFEMSNDQIAWMPWWATVNLDYFISVSMAQWKRTLRFTFLLNVVSFSHSNMLIFFFLKQIKVIENALLYFISSVQTNSISLGK